MLNGWKTFYKKDSLTEKYIREAISLMPDTLFSHYINKKDIVVHIKNCADDNVLCLEVGNNLLMSYDEYSNYFELIVAFIDGYLTGKGIDVYE